MPHLPSLDLCKAKPKKTRRKYFLQSLTETELALIFRVHSQLQGSFAENMETWLTDAGTLPRYLDLVPSAQPHDSRLVEIGCYQPSVGYYFKLGWREIVGFFKDEGEASCETSYADASGASARFVRIDVETEKLPLAENWADVVIMMEVLEHFAIDPMHALWEANRVLKTGGRLILSTPNGAAWQYARRILCGQAAWGGMEFTGFSTNRHNRLYDAMELVTLLEQAGFATVRCDSKDYGHPRKSWREYAFCICLRAIDLLGCLYSRHKRERNKFLVVDAVKQGPPKVRFPDAFYLSAKNWPGITEQRDKVIAQRNHRAS